MHEFPLFAALCRGATQLLRNRMFLLGLLIAAELLPLLLGPFLLLLRSVNRWEETYQYWLHPWAYSQVVILAFASVALPGRWHVRVFLALLGVAWVWGAYMTGLQSSVWSIYWVRPSIGRLAPELVWLFAISAFLASLLVSVSGLTLRWETRFPRTNAPRQWQFSLGFLMTAIFVAALTMLVFRAAIGAPGEWGRPRVFTGIEALDFLRFAVWGMISSVSMLAAVCRHRHWLWLLVVFLIGLGACFLLAAFGTPVIGGLWTPLAMTVHPFLIAAAWPKYGVEFPGVVRLEALHRAMASVR